MRLYTRNTKRSPETHLGRPGLRGITLRRVIRLGGLAIAGILLLTVVLVLPWRWFAPPTTAFMLRESLFGEQSVRHRWTDWEDIAVALPVSVVAAEDQKFPAHGGFDWEAIGDAMERNRDGGRLRGGSTISQQVAKNMYLWSGQSFLRKGVEAYFTVWIELLWPKRRILEVYVNVAEFGPGVFGVGAASAEYRGKAPSELSGYDAAVLTAVLPSPKRMSAAQPSEYVRTRADQIQTAVGRLGGSRYLDGL